MAYWLMVCRHRAGMEELRARHRDAHREHVATGGGGVARVLTGGALTLEDGETPVGNFGVMDAPDRAAVQAFAEADPFAKAGLVEAIEITPIAARFQAQRIDPLTR
ncbi:YciI family protein [uncultured Alsobacter sp.]|uniref:YciI family protein n=1 Tax=uncultured Alsobacter sp. TaxID=1748258 RepID=UPI0025E9D526|nr:YciI family protein [uncultured Alsobacter sp.]